MKKLISQAILFAILGIAAINMSSAGATILDLPWWRRNVPSVDQRLFAGAYGNGTYVVAGEMGRIFSSNDGRSWIARESGTTVTIREVTFVGGMFVAGGDGTLLSSTNGITWVDAHGLPSTNDVNWNYISLGSRVAYGNGAIVIVTSGSGYISRSTNGIDWEDLNVGEVYFEAVAFGNGRFVAVGQSGVSYVSIDGKNWTPGRIPYFAGTLSGIAFGNGRFVAVSGGAIYSSTNGADWDGHDSGGTLLYHVGFSGGRFVAVGWNVGSSRVDLQACKLEYSIVSPK